MVCGKSTVVICLNVENIVAYSLKPLFKNVRVFISGYLEYKGETGKAL
jgi:hypothetical protein